MIKKILLLSLTTGVIGCTSTPSENNKVYEAWVEHTYTPPVRHNIYEKKALIPFRSGSLMRNIISNKLITQTLDFGVQTITRCDKPVTLCQHGVVHVTSQAQYFFDQVDSGQIKAEGKFVFNIAKSQTVSSDRGYVREEIADGVPLLEEETIEVPFSGVISEGRPIQVEGPYNSSYALAFERIKLSL